MAHLGSQMGDLCSKMLVPKSYLDFSGPHRWTLSYLIDKSYRSIFIRFFFNRHRISWTIRENWNKRKKTFRKKMAPRCKKILTVTTGLAADLASRARCIVLIREFYWARRRRFFLTFPASQIRFTTFSETISERVDAAKRNQNPKFRSAGQSLICHSQDLVIKPGG